MIYKRATKKYILHLLKNNFVWSYALTKYMSEFEAIFFIAMKKNF